MYAKTKSLVHDNFTEEDITVLTEYDMLPISHVKVKNRKALVNLLNNENIIKVSEIKIYTPNLSQSLPLIDPLGLRMDYTGQGTAVVILDTGVDYTVAPFNCADAGDPGCPVVFVDDMASDDGVMDGTIPHGTVVSAVVHGVASGADLIVLDVAYDSEEGKMKDKDIFKGINWAISHQDEYNIVVLNMSFGEKDVGFSSPCPSSDYEPLLEDLRDEGIIPVASSGNDGFIDQLAEPACAPSAVSVGSVADATFTSTGCDETLYPDKVYCSSNAAYFLTLLAPGCFITAGGETMCGTSFAAPMVSGAIAILRSQDVAPDETLDETISRLRGSRYPILDYRNDTHFPRLDLLRAILPSKDNWVFFDALFYYENYDDLADRFGANYDSLYSHWIHYGISQGKRAARYFDPKYYHDTYTDIASTYGTDWEAIYDHWMAYGIDEGRRGSLEFDPQYYGDHYTDLNGTDRALYVHWILFGIDEGRRGSLDFDPVYYLETYPELADQFGTDYKAALDHWIVTGKAEGRAGSAEADYNAPTPNLSTFSTVPYVYGSTSIRMTATEASDETGVEYYFDETTGYGHDSGWQSSRSYTDTGLAEGRTYTYRVKTRDTSVNYNETSPSSLYSAKIDSSPKALCGAAPMYRSRSNISASRNAAGKALLPLAPAFLCLCAWGVISRRRKY